MEPFSSNPAAPITLRMAVPSDAEEMLAIYAFYVENTAVTFEYQTPDAEEFKRRIIHTLERYPYLAALYQGRIIGYAYASPFKTKFFQGFINNPCNRRISIKCSIYGIPRIFIFVLRQ